MITMTVMTLQESREGRKARRELLKVISGRS